MDMYQRVNSGEYESKLESPAHIRKPFAPRNQTAKKAQEYANALAEYEAAIVERKPKMDAYNADVQRLEQKFKADAISEVFGEFAERFPALTQKLWDKAWDEGHSVGYVGVLDELIDYKDILDALRDDLVVKQLA